MTPLFPSISAVALPLADGFAGHHDWGDGWCRRAPLDARLGDEGG